MKLLILLLLPFGLFAQNWESPLNWLNGAPVPPNIDCLGTNAFSQIISGTACSGDVTTFPDSIFSVSNHTATYATGQTPNLTYGTDSSGVAGLRNLIVQQLPSSIVSSYPASFFTVTNHTAAFSTGQNPNLLFGTDLAGNVGFVPNVVMTPQQYGAQGNGTADDTAAISAAITANRSLLFPPGTYKITGELPLPANTSISGYGATLLVSAANVDAFHQANVSPVAMNSAITGLTIANAGANANTRGFACTFCQNVSVKDVTFLGMQNSIYMDRGGQLVTFTNIASEGTLLEKAGNIIFTSTTDSEYIFGTQINGYNIFNIGNGVQGGILCRRCVGMTFSGLNANDMHIGGDQAGVVFENDCQGDRLVNSIFGAGSSAVVMQTGSGVSVVPSFITVSNVDSDQQTIAGYLVNDCFACSFDGGKITSSGAVNSASAVLVQGTSQHLQFSNLQINGFTTGAAFNLAASATDVSIHDNKVQNTNVGIGFNSTLSNIRFSNNEFDTVAAPVSGTPAGSGNYITGNIGASSAGNVAPNFPATNTPVTNASAYTVQYIIAGGAVSAVTLNSVTFGLPLQGLLRPGDTISISYSGSPAWVWIAEP